MDKQIITFTANEQHLHKTGGLDIFATKTVAYIEAHFDLGQNWSGYDSIEAVWWNDYVRPVRTVLDTEGICVVPPEVLMRKGAVFVNLVGVISSENVLTDRLTSVPITALTNKFNAQLGEGATTPLTPSEYEQFVATVKADADRAEDAKEDARGYASDAEASAENAHTSEVNAGTSETNAHTSEVNAKASEDNAKISEDNASASATSAENSATQAESAKDDAEDARDEIRSMRAEATTLPAGSSATASYSGGLLSLGIPKGDKGDRGQQGIQGETGATPNLTIGTVETLEPTEDATATITGTAENPVLNLGIPQGEVGEVSYADLKTLLPMDTATGDIVSIPDGQPIIPVDSLKISLEPIQSGSGTPSPDNVRPISGHTEVDAHRTGVNVWDEEWRSGYYTNTGEFSSVSTCVANVNPIKVTPRTTYYISLNARYANGVRLVFRDENKNFLSVSTEYSSTTFTTPANCYWLDFGTFSASGISGYNNDISINSPSTDTEYHAYNGTTYHTDLGQTVYGGVLDVISGELVVDRGSYTFTGNETISMSSSTPQSGKVFRAVLPSGHRYKNATGVGDAINVISSKYKAIAGRFGVSDMNVGEFKQYGDNQSLDFCSLATTVELFQSEIAGTIVVYELATPTTVQLTPTEVKLLLGDNNVWSDGDVAIVYSADVTKWIEKQLS